MIQQILALIVIIFFLIRLFSQKKKKEINSNEFLLWLVFWLLAAAAVIFIKQIDQLVRLLGFSGTAINILVYLVVLALIYQVFRLRLAIAKMEKNISELNQQIALKK
ncbi:MAG: DUF2304 domain-containing protein [Patescibacteria group bacterium]|jgi:hypothetical protein